jgi:nucleoid DNA-binding protein
MTKIRINKKKFVQAILESNAGLRKATVSLYVDLVLKEIVQQFKKGTIIEIRGFGTFYPYFKKARTYKIPKIEGTREIKGRTTLKFKPSHQILMYEKQSS